jgi:glycosyltransferase involved in cell wall biosynthesis
MPRVVFAAHAFPRHPGDLTGGFLLRLAQALRDHGIEVTAVAPSAAGLPAREDLDGIEVRRYRYAPRRLETLAYTGAMHARAANPGGALALAGLLGAGTLALRRAVAGTDAGLVHAHWWFPAGVQALWSRRRPLVTTLHGTDVRLARSRPAARAACARVLRASARITAVSSWLAAEAASIAPDCADRIRVAPMPVDDAVFSVNGQAQGGDLDRGAGELLFVGRLDRQKGLDVALRALAALHGDPGRALRLRVVGSGPDEAALRDLATELGIADRIRWESTLPLETLADRYRYATALLVPGADEGLGLVAVEAQLCGTPVIAAASGGLLDVVANNKTGRTFPPGQAAALAQVIEEVVTGPAAAASLAATARERAAARFSTHAAASAYAAIYAEALRT